MSNDLPYVPPTEFPQFVPGYVYDPVAMAENKAFRTERGDLVMASQQDKLPGSYSRARAEGKTHVILRSVEKKLLGRYRRPYLQRAGTCVSRGFARGIQTSLDYAVQKMGELLKPVEIAFAPIYTIARVEIGKYCVGNGDGAILAHAAQGVHDLGVATMDLFKGMSEDAIEQLAVRNSMVGARTPAEWLAAMKGHTCKTFAPDSLDLLLDCLTEGYASPYGNGWVTGMPNEAGLSRLGSRGAHCRCFTGWYLDENDRVQLISDESWGRFPAGQTNNADQTMDIEKMPCITIHTASGPILLPPGSVGIDAKQCWDACVNGGEVWAVSAASYPVDSIVDTGNAKTVA